MNYREYAHALLDRIPEGKLPYVVSFLMGAAIPDSSDDAYCEWFLKKYQNDPDPHKTDSIPLEQLEQELGISTNKNQ